MVEETAKGEEALVEVKEKEEEEATVADSEEEIIVVTPKCSDDSFHLKDAPSSAVNLASTSSRRRKSYLEDVRGTRIRTVTSPCSDNDGTIADSIGSLLSPARQSRICEPKT